MPNPELVAPGRVHRLGLVLVLLFGAGLRFWAIDAGAPYRIANDEPFVVGMALQIMRSGDFNPHFFSYGGLAIYVHTIVASVRFLGGAMAGEWTSLDQIWIGEFLTAARIVTAALGSLTLWIVYRAGLRFGVGTALLGTFIMAVLGQHVRESHLALTDVPLTLLTATVLLVSLRAVERGGLIPIFIAGVAVGLTAAVKYNGAVALVMPLIAALALPGGMRAAGTLVVCAGAAGGFLLGSPYAVLDLPAFLNGVASLMQGYNQDRPATDAAVIYVKYLRNWFSWSRVVPPGFGYPALVVALGGAFLLVRRRDRPASRAAVGVLLVFPCLYFLLLVWQGSLQYGRYLLPLAPMLSLALAAGLIGGWKAASRLGSGWRRVLRAALVALLILPTGSAVGWARTYALPRTAELASAWIVNTATERDAVVVEAAAVLLPPAVRAIHVTRLVDEPLDAYLAQGATYLVTTSSETDRYFEAQEAYVRQAAAYRQLIARATSIETFLAGPDTEGPAISILRIRP